MTWTDDRIEKLKELWAKGVSASGIAKELGGLSRNAVIGKAYRLDLASRARKRPAKFKATAPEVAANKGGGLSAAQIIHRKEGETKPLPKESPVDQTGTFQMAKGIPDAVTRHEGDARCHFPIGDPSDPEFHFCTNAAKPGRPYCPEHCEVAYQPLSTRDWFEERRAWAYANPEHKLAKRILKRLAERAA